MQLHIQNFIEVCIKIIVSVFLTKHVKHISIVWLSYIVFLSYRFYFVLFQIINNNKNFGNIYVEIIFISSFYNMTVKCQKISLKAILK